jgi:hypothetical protein
MSTEPCPFCAEAIDSTGKVCPFCGKTLSGRHLLAEATTRAVPLSGGAIVLLVLAVLGGLLGLLFLSQATTGVGLMTVACLLAICARIAQAGTHHTAMMRYWTNRDKRLADLSPYEQGQLGEQRKSLGA